MSSKYFNCVMCNFSMGSNVAYPERDSSRRPSPGAETKSETENPFCLFSANTLQNPIHNAPLLFFNQDQKVCGLFHFYIAVTYETIQNQLKKACDIGLPKE